MQPRFIYSAVVILVASMIGAGCERSSGQGASPEPLRQIPTFRADASWPEIPAQWRLGEVSSIGFERLVFTGLAPLAGD